MILLIVIVLIIVIVIVIMATRKKEVTYRHYPKKDSYGDDIDIITGTTIDIEECKKKCAENPKCAGFDYVLPNDKGYPPKCQFKSNKFTINRLGTRGWYICKGIIVYKIINNITCQK